MKEEFDRPVQHRMEQLVNEEHRLRAGIAVAPITRTPVRRTSSKSTSSERHAR